MVEIDWEEVERLKPIEDAWNEGAKCVICGVDVAFSESMAPRVNDLGFPVCIQCARLAEKCACCGVVTSKGGTLCMDCAAWHDGGCEESGICKWCGRGGVHAKNSSGEWCCPSCEEYFERGQGAGSAG